MAIKAFLMPYRIYILLAGIAMIILGVASCEHKNRKLAKQRAQIEAQKAEIEILNKAEEAYTSSMTYREEDRNNINVSSTKRRMAAEEALEENQDWASQPIPADVLIVLRGED